MLKLTPEVTTIGAHIVSKFQPCTLVLVKLLHKVYSETSFMTISFQDHCTSIWVKISHTAYLVRNSQPSVYVWAIFNIPFQTLVPIQHQKDYLAIPFKTLALVYLQHNGYRTAHIPTTNVWLAGWRPATCIWRVEGSSHLSPFEHPASTRKYGLLQL